jgi:small nuclear ribonucleoprotein G
VLDDAVEEKDGGEKVRLGMVVRCDRFIPNYLFVAGHFLLVLTSWFMKVIRGNSVVMLEALERIGGDRNDR